MTPEIKTELDTMEAMHLAGQHELDFCMMGLARLINAHPTVIPKAEVFELLDELMDRKNELAIEPPKE